MIARMTAALAHRGPDASASWSGDGVVFGHRRLAVIDLDGGAQPMHDPALGLTVTYNGELYDYLALNRRLDGLGFTARTRSDTETLLHAYAAWGEACVDHLHGMFAFVIHDAQRRRLFAARDRMGKKPLYYVHDPRRGWFGFASEAKALLQHPDVPRVMDPEAAARYLLFEHVPAPQAIYRGMRKLEAGHALAFDLEAGTLRGWRYWDPEDAAAAAPAGSAPATLEAWCGRIRTALGDAVERRLVSDVPLGVFLSGGIDSAAVAALMVERVGGGRVKTFTIGFRDRRFDESGAARAVARRLGTGHHEEILDSAAVADALTQVGEMLDEPFADASILPTWLLARFARRHVTVALGGDGGDEAFAGYATFDALPALALYDRWVPSWLDRGVIRPLAAALPAGHGYLSADFKARQFLRGAKAAPDERLWRWLGAFVPEELSALLAPGALEGLDPARLYDPVRALHARVAARDPVARDAYVYARSYLAEGVLTKVDRATMACSLEARSPFLDPEVVALAHAIPSRWKVRGGEKKWILRRALRGLLPDAVLARGKRGFGPPIGAWFRGRLRDQLCDTLSERSVREAGFLRPAAVARLLREHLEGRVDHRKPLFALFMLERWRRRWLRPA